MLSKLALNFYTNFSEQNSDQIKSKARFFNVDKREIENELFILIATRFDEFDRAKGSAEAFFFGHLHAILKRYQYDPSHFALSLAEEPEVPSYALQAEDVLPIEKTPCFTNTKNEKAAGCFTLRSLAEAASGKTAISMAEDLGITARRLNQILQKKRGDAGNQFSLPFDGGRE